MPEGRHHENDRANPRRACGVRASLVSHPRNFFWTKPLGLRTFRQSLDKAQESAVLAANQGLYNGFLAAGLIFGLLYPEPRAGLHIEIFFLICVIAAGAYGGYSVSPRILVVQAGPALLALVLLLWS